MLLITWQWAKTVQMPYRTRHNPKPPQTSLSQAPHVLYTTGVTPRHSYLQTYQTHCMQPSPWTLKAHTHTLFIFNTARKRAELKTAVIRCLTKDSQYKLTDEWIFFTWPAIAFFVFFFRFFKAFSVTIFSIAVFSSFTTWLLFNS